MAERIDYIADTSAIIGVLRRDAAAESAVAGKSFAITFVTLAELSVGVLKAARPDAAWSRIQDVIGNRQMLHVSTVTPAIYARIYFDLERRGAMIPSTTSGLQHWPWKLGCRSSRVMSTSRGSLACR